MLLAFRTLLILLFSVASMASMMSVFDSIFWDRYASYTTFAWAEKYTFQKRGPLHWSVNFSPSEDCPIGSGDIKLTKRKGSDLYNYKLTYPSCRSKREQILFYSEASLDSMSLEDLLQWRYQNQNKKFSYLRSQLGRFSYFNDGTKLRYFLDLTHRTGKLNDFQCNLIIEGRYSEETCINVYPAHADKVFVLKKNPMSTTYFIDSEQVSKAQFYKSFKGRIREFQFSTMYLNFRDVGAFPN